MRLEENPARPRAKRCFCRTRRNIPLPLGRPLPSRKPCRNNMRRKYINRSAFQKNAGMTDKNRKTPSKINPAVTAIVKQILNALFLFIDVLQNRRYAPVSGNHAASRIKQIADDKSRRDQEGDGDNSFYCFHIVFANRAPKAVLSAPARLFLLLFLLFSFFPGFLYPFERQRE